MPPQIPNFSPLANAYSRHDFADDAAPTHLLGLARGRATLRKEQVGVDTQAVGFLVPLLVFGFKLEFH